MKHSIPLQPISAAFAVLVFSSTACADDLIKQQILKLYPQADTDKHGVISDAEDAALSRLALKRHPNADTDGDGILFDAEKKVRLRLIANRVAASAEIPTSESAKKPATHANVKYERHEQQVFDIWLPARSEQPWRLPLPGYLPSL